MIPANKNPILDSLLYAYFRCVFRSRFSGVYASGIEHYKELDRSRPAICFANHTNWWDGLVAFYLSRFNWRKKAYCMMEERQMKHYSFLAWIGAFSVDLSSSLRASASVRYALRLLEKPESLCWIFPQSKITPSHHPISVKEGTAYIANRVSRTQLLPVVFRYAFFHEDKPHIFVRIGAPYEGQRPVTDEVIAECLSAELARLDEMVAQHDLSLFQAIVPPKLSINKRWEWIRRAYCGQLDSFNPENG